MCSGLEGSYVLSTDGARGQCSGVPASTRLEVGVDPAGYRLEASWLRGCTLRAVRPGSCQYEARCEALVAGRLQPLLLRVTRNSSGFYGPAEIGAEPATCSLDVDTSAP